MREIFMLCWPFWLAAAVMLLEAGAERIERRKHNHEAKR